MPCHAMPYVRTAPSTFGSALWAALSLAEIWHDSALGGSDASAPDRRQCSNSAARASVLGYPKARACA